MRSSGQVVIRRTRVAGAMVFAGTALLAAGLLGPTAGADEGFTACPSGTEKLVKFEANGWEAEDESVTSVELITPTLSGGSWESDVPIAAVVVKGGSGEDSLDIIEYDPHATSGSYSNVNLLNEGGNVPDISFIEFCAADERDTTTTTTEATTTTTAEVSTTTTEAPTTTTTAAPAVGGETQTQTSSSTVGVQVAGETQELPRTGTAANALALVGAGMILGGVSIMGATRRRFA